MSNTPEHIDVAAVMASENPRVGSVQTMYELEVEGRKCLLSEAPDKGSVFDIGAVFSIPGSGAQRQTLRHRIYTRLMDPAAWANLTEDDLGRCFADKARATALLDSVTLKRLAADGVRTHHLGLVDRATGDVLRGATGVFSDLVLMEGYPVIKPQRANVVGVPVYDYSAYFDASTKIMALEHIVRLGNPGGSSFQSRYERLARLPGDEGQEFLAAYGLTELKPWSKMPHPIVEWSTKFEGYDRYLSAQESLLVSGVDADRMNEVVELLLLCTVQVNKFIAESGLDLWDLKWELALRGDELVVVDTIDHDSVRITLSLTHPDAGDCVVHFNKQSVRDYFKIFHGDWHAALNEAKRKSNLPGSKAFKDVYWDGVESGEYPPPPELTAEFADLQGRKYACVTAGAEAPSDESRELAEEEIAYYAGQGRLDDFFRFNVVTN